MTRNYYYILDFTGIYKSTTQLTNRSQQASAFFHSTTAAKKCHNSNDGANGNHEDWPGDILHSRQLHVVTYLQVNIDSHAKESNTTKLSKQNEIHTFKLNFQQKISVIPNKYPCSVGCLFNVFAVGYIN